MKKLLSGNEAIARGAWESGVSLAAGYPGTPSTEILENVAKEYKDDIYCEWSPNEKVAFEVATGAALAGARALVTMKHVGLNVAADPLMTLAYTGTVGGFIVLVADDPGMHSSQNEQDTRNFAKFAKIPILEPADSEEAKEFFKYGIELSERFKTPVILRTTTRVSHSRGLVDLSGERTLSEKPVGFERNPQAFVTIPAWAKQMRYKLEDRLKELRKAASESPLNRIEWKDKKVGIITSGVVYQYVSEVFPEVSILKLGWSFPYPDDLIREFASGVEKLIVIEELDDFLEEHIRAMGIECIGKSVIPNIGELMQDVLFECRLKLEELGIFATKTVLPEKLSKPTEPLPNAPGRPPVLCPGCPHRGIFYALGKFDVIVTGDIGCYTLGVLPPLSRIDTTICMGAGVSMAHGMDKAKNPKKVVGILGDSTFFHSGITGLLDIAYNKGSATIIVVDNRITAMTGHQDNPGTGRTLMGEETREASIEELARACGISNVITLNPRDVKGTVAILKEAINSPEPYLIVSKAPCPLHLRQPVGPIVCNDLEKCKRCGLCLKLGCPAIEKDGEDIRINQILCAGCQMCKNLCPVAAIQ